MKKIGLLFCALFVSAVSVFGQGARNIKINEVLTDNTANLQDEFGVRQSWIELANISFSTYNVRGMYVTTDRRVLNKNITVAQRISMMSLIPSGDNRTSLSARQHLVLYCNSNPAKGVLHIDAVINRGNLTWIALYDANAIDIIDSVTIPKLTANQSYARVKDGSKEWTVKEPESVTPGSENLMQANETKSDRMKREDPYGVGITVLSMGIVFFCLSLLYVFFRLLGIFVTHKRTVKRTENMPLAKTEEKLSDIRLKANSLQKVKDKEIYIAVIAMALKQYEDDVHDFESNVITIKPHTTHWNIHPKETTMT